MTGVHHLKSYPYLFEATRDGTKKHDMRRDDRGFTVGDTVVLREYDKVSSAYTGRSLTARISYITSVENPCALSGDGLKFGYCILSLRFGPWLAIRNLFTARRKKSSTNLL